MIKSLALLALLTPLAEAKPAAPAKPAPHQTKTHISGSVTVLTDVQLLGNELAFKTASVNFDNGLITSVYGGSNIYISLLHAKAKH